MAKPEWGMKRTCQSCTAHFYDLNKKPILCPKCGHTFDPELSIKPRRGRPPSAEKALRERNALAAQGADVHVLDDEDVLADDSDDNLDDDADLDDDVSVSDVIEHVDNKDDM